MFNLKQGTLIAIAAGSLFATACKKSEEKKTEAPPAAQPAATEREKEPLQPPAAKPTEGEKTAVVHCQGVNDCKGKGGCKSAANACKGQNACKGKSFVEMASEEDCKAKGGTVTPM